MADTIKELEGKNIETRNMTAGELKDFIAEMPEGTVISLEVKVVLEDG